MSTPMTSPAAPMTRLPAAPSPLLPKNSSIGAPHITSLRLQSGMLNMSLKLISVIISKLSRASRPTFTVDCAKSFALSLMLSMSPAVI